MNNIKQGFGTGIMIVVTSIVVTEGMRFYDKNRSKITNGLNKVTTKTKKFIRERKLKFRAKKNSIKAVD